ncbi:Spo0E family sporulation regulatory protein-aspartic acid phosphatase [Brevibacillus sp. B_LB10_24]|uniref:Spo0E family sporulation regulatory protein-aspartic acid phosphatase n=1 Tax=Brevibacillus sp. B_LB10_24 TaxID=3380645 RepID=UPI0038BA2C55
MEFQQAKQLLKIEELRYALNSLAREKGLTSPEILETSKKLDHLLNEYYRLCESAGRFGGMFQDRS